MSAIHIEFQRGEGDYIGEDWVVKESANGSSTPIGVSCRDKAEAIRAARVWCRKSIPLQPCEVPGRLRLAASYLRECGVLMDYIGGFGQWGDKGREAIGAAEIAKQWADEMEAR